MAEINQTQPSKGISCADEDYLDEDPIISSQLFACLSIFTPNSIKTPEGEVIDTGNKVRAFKIRGVYSSYDKAEKRCEEIRKFDKYHHVFVGEVGKWLPWDDDVSNAEEAVYAEKKLNDMMKAYHESQENAKSYTEERKAVAHAAALKKKRDLEKANKIQEKEEEKEDKDDENIINNLNEIKKELNEEENKITDIQKKILEEEEEILNNKQKIDNKEESINKIDEELEKARVLYEELIKKYNLEKK
jgi:phage-related minor tail protein